MCCCSSSSQHGPAPYNTYHIPCGSRVGLRVGQAGIYKLESPLLCASIPIPVGTRPYSGACVGCWCFLRRVYYTTTSSSTATHTSSGDASKRATSKSQVSACIPNASKLSRICGHGGNVKHMLCTFNTCEHVHTGYSTPTYAARRAHIVHKFRM